MTLRYDAELTACRLTLALQSPRFLSAGSTSDLYVVKLVTYWDDATSLMIERDALKLGSAVPHYGLHDDTGILTCELDSQSLSVVRSNVVRIKRQQSSKNCREQTSQTL